MERCRLPRGDALLAQLTFSPRARAKQQCISFAVLPRVSYFFHSTSVPRGLIIHCLQTLPSRLDLVAGVSSLCQKGSQ